AGATRVAVGVDIIDDFSATVEGIEPGQLTSWIRDRHIAVETNPDEDIAQDDVDSLADHPLPLLQQLGFTCAVGTTALTQQFVSLNEALGYGLEEFFELTVAAMQNSFSTQEHRQRLIETVILPAYEKLSDAEFAEDAAAREAEEAEAADDESTPTPTGSPKALRRSGGHRSSYRRAGSRAAGLSQIPFALSGAGCPAIAQLGFVSAQPPSPTSADALYHGAGCQSRSD